MRVTAVCLCVCVCVTNLAPAYDVHICDVFNQCFHFFIRGMEHTKYTKISTIRKFPAKLLRGAFLGNKLLYTRQLWLCHMTDMAYHSCSVCVCIQFLMASWCFGRHQQRIALLIRFCTDSLKNGCIHTESTSHQPACQLIAFHT